MTLLEFDLTLNRIESLIDDAITQVAQEIVRYEEIEIGLERVDQRLAYCQSMLEGGGGGWT
jgi:hypothetical protein